jgi:ParB-like chromosome segregation protein Spo0J/ABC-type ATPase involved in cell division/GNAT superfamily N-acetyltransferase
MEAVPIDSVTQDPHNARRHPEKNLDAIRSSLTRFGQQKPIVVDGRGVIVAGNGTHAAAKALGWTHVNVVRTALVGKEALAFALADNRTGELARWDDQVLAEFLADPDLGDVGFTEEEVERILDRQEGSGSADDVPEMYAVYVQCEGEDEQKELLEELITAGHEPRAMVSARPAAPEAAAAPPPPVPGSVRVERRSKVELTPRVLQLQGMFDVPPAEETVQAWDVKLDLPADWSVGVIVGPSGAGKTTIARELFGDRIVSGWEWPAGKSILDGFPAGMGIADVIGLLSGVGFSSPPAWRKPFGVLSNGEQFRVNLARTLAEMTDLAVVDEFTSVVDRTVAKVGSAAVQKEVRRRKQRLVAVTCHYDVLDWLEPDWVYEPHTGRLARGRLRRRPPIELDVVRCDPAAWDLFKPHHYLSAGHHKAARCFVALYEGRPAAFCSVLPFPHAKRPGWREHRTVCLPDFQGVGIGNALSNYVASLYRATGKPYNGITGHPGFIFARARSKDWRVSRAAKIASSANRGSLAATLNARASVNRLTWSFEYVGPDRADDARGFGLPVRGTA